MLDQLLNSANYYFNPYSFPMFITALLVILLGVYVFIQDKNLVSQSFLIMTLSAGIWQAGIGMMYLMRDTMLILSFYKIFIFLGAVMIAPGIYFFTASSLGLLEEKKKYVLANYTIAFAFYIMSLMTDWLVRGVNEYFWGPYVLYGPLSIPFLFFFFTLVIRSLLLYHDSIRKMESGIKQDQIKLFTISLAIAAVGSVDFLSCFPPLEVYPFGYLPVLIFISLQTYAILRYKKASLSEIFGAMEDGIIVTDRNGRITEVNHSVEKITGLRRQDFLGNNVFDVFPLIADKVEDPEKVEALLKEITTKPGKISDEDITFIEPALHISTRSSPLMDRFGTRSGSVIVFRNITERKKLEGELRQYKEELEELVKVRTAELAASEEKYRALVNHAQVGIGIHQDGRIVFTNRQLLLMLGFREEEFIGLSISCLIHPDEVEEVMSRAWNRYNGKEVIDTYESQLIRKDGSIMPSIISNAVVEYNGKRATLITIVDITESKLRKELEQVNQELEMFAYSVSHDLRAPLRSIDGFSQALLEDYEEQLDDEGQDYLRRIRAASQRMASMIDAILQLSRIGRYEMRRKQVNLSALAQDIAADLKVTDPDRQVEFVIAEGVVASGDPTLIRTALENLIGNAWKFTQKHENARIEFGVVRQGKKSIYYVRDNGAGFDMRYADKLFAPFQRLHSTAEYKGTGVGLASVQRIVHRHGGNIRAESAVGKGTTFYFTLE
ncbi:MAG TPA: PAS domain S-box protein [Thermoanaerobacterales bacterium]|nr:PAS domain S-box protein [Thermoanaerobacterales bacterium]